MRVLMASPGPPSAGGKGYQVRAYHQILGLAGRHEITLITFASTNHLEPELSKACRKVVAIPWSLATAAATLPLRDARLPLSVGLYRDPRMVDALVGELQHDSFDIVQLQLVRMAPYLDQSSTVPVVLDLLDAAELNMRERAKAAMPGVKQLLEIEARRLGAYERKAIARAALSLLISKRDFEYVGSPPNARVLPNGIDPRQTVGGADRQATTVVFSGTMSYFPNADAAIWFAREILPLVRQAIPAAQFRIVGRAPSASVTNLASLPGVTVTGAVTDIADEISRAAVSVCPMRFGSGMQTKILEAMASQTPVVATGKALEGIPEDLRPFVRQADMPLAFAESVVRTLNVPDRAREAAREAFRAIRSRHTWRHMVADLERFYEEAVIAASTSTRAARPTR